MKVPRVCHIYLTSNSRMISPLKHYLSFVYITKNYNPTTAIQIVGDFKKCPTKEIETLKTEKKINFDKNQDHVH